MKLVTMATALELGLVTPTTIVNDNGVVTFQNGRGQPPTTIKNWDLRANGTDHDDRDPDPSRTTSGRPRSRRRSARIEPVQVFDLFGFGQKTGVELPGEVPGHRPDPGHPAWSVVDLATNAFGQGIAVTPLQMLNAVSAIGNDGVLMRPTIVKEIDGPDGPG